MIKLANKIALSSILGGDEGMEKKALDLASLLRMSRNAANKGKLLNTSMTKRAGLIPALGITGAIGAAAGGLAGHYGSDKTNITPATVLGALGGGAGSAAGAATIVPLLNAIANKADEANLISTKLLMNNASLQSLKKKPSLSLGDLSDLQDLRGERRALKSSLAVIPKWIHALNKHPGRYLALAAGGLGLGATAGGALGAKLGITGGDALA